MPPQMTLDSPLEIRDAAALSTDVPEEIERAHRAISEAEWQFRCFAEQVPELLSQFTFSNITQASHISRYPVQPWPVLASPETTAALHAANVGVNRLVRALPELAFGSDPARLAEFYGYDDPEVIDLLLGEPSWLRANTARGDFVATGDGFKCLELNAGANLGGWEAGILGGLLLRHPLFKRFQSEHQVHLSIRETQRYYFDHMVETALDAGLPRDGQLNLALFTPDKGGLFGRSIFGRQMKLAWRQAVERGDSALRGELIPVQDPDLSMEGSQLHADGKPAQVLFHTEPYLPSEMLQAYRQRRLHIYNGPTGALLGDKRNLALLSRLADEGALTDEDRDTVRRHIPWSRFFHDGQALRDGEEVSLLEHARAERDDLVIKKAGSKEGRDVVLGASVDDDGWNAALARALEEGDWILQEYVESLPYLYQQGEYGCTVHDVLWGPFLFGDTFGGAGIRFQPKRGRRILNAARGATVGMYMEAAKVAVAGA